MKHHVLVTRKPEIAAVSPLEAKMEFLVTLTGQVINFIFQSTGGTIKNAT